MSSTEVCACGKIHTAKSDEKDARSLRSLRLPTGKRRAQTASTRHPEHPNLRTVPLICDDCVTLRLIDVSTLYLIDRAERYKNNDVLNMPFELGITPVHDGSDACVADAVFSAVKRHNVDEEEFGVNLAKQTIASFVCNSQREASAQDIGTPVDEKLECKGSAEGGCMDENFVNLLQNQLTLGCETSGSNNNTYRTEVRTFTYSTWFTAEAYKWRSQQDDDVVTLGEIAEIEPNMPFTCALTLLNTTAVEARCMARVMVRDNSVRTVRQKQARGELKDEVAEMMVKRLLDDNRIDATKKDSPNIRKLFFAPAPPLVSNSIANLFIKQSLSEAIKVVGTSNEQVLRSLQRMAGSTPGFAAVMSIVDENSHRLQRLMRRWRSLVLKYVPLLHTAIVAASNPESDVDCMAARCDLLARELDLDAFVAETERFYNEVRISEKNSCSVPFLFGAGPKELNDPREIFQHTASEVYNYCARPLSEDESYEYEYDAASTEGVAHDADFLHHSRCNSQCSCGDDDDDYYYYSGSGEDSRRVDKLAPEDDWMYTGEKLRKRQQKRADRETKRALAREQREREAQLQTNPDTIMLRKLPAHVRASLEAKNCVLDHLPYEQEILVDALRKLTQLLDVLHLECVVTAAEAHQTICQTQPFTLGNGAVARALVNCILGTTQLPPFFVDNDSAEMETYKNVTSYAMQHSSPLTFAAYLAEYVRDEIRFNEASRSSHFSTTCNTLEKRRAERTLLCGDEGSVLAEFSVVCELWKYCRKRRGHDTSNAKEVSWGCDVSTIVLEQSTLMGMMRTLCENEQRANADFQLDYYSDDSEV